MLLLQQSTREKYAASDDVMPCGEHVQRKKDVVECRERSRRMLPINVDVRQTLDTSFTYH